MVCEFDSKVLMVTPHFHPLVGGCETSVKYLSKELNRKGIKTDVMTFNLDKKRNAVWQLELDTVDGINVIRIPTYQPKGIFYAIIKNFFKMRFIPVIGFQKYFKDYDIIHFQDNVDNTFPMFSLGVNKPKIFHYRTFDNGKELFNKDVFFKLFRRYYTSSLAHLHIGNSLLTSKYMKEIIPEDKITYIHNGVDVENFKPMYEKEERSIIFFSRIIYWKGLHILLKSLEYIKDPCKLYVIGGIGNDKEWPDYGDYVEKLMNNVSAKTIHSVIYLGEKDHDVIVKFCQKSQIYVFPFLGTCSFGITQVEAMACGTPVVTTISGANKEIVRDGLDGRLVPRGDIEALGKVLDELLSDPALCQTYGRNARERVEALFSWDTISDKLILEYHKLLKNH